MNPIRRFFSDIEIGVFKFIADAFKKLEEHGSQKFRAEKEANELWAKMLDSEPESKEAKETPPLEAPQPASKINVATETKQELSGKEGEPPKPPTIKQVTKPMLAKQPPKPRIYREPMQGIPSVEEYIWRNPKSEIVPKEELSHGELVALADLKHLCTYSEEIELRPEEILLLDFIDGKSTDLNLPEYFTWKYHIDFKSTFERFGKGGYLEYAPIEYCLSKQKKETMQRLLEQQGLETKGRKDELVKRLLAYSDPIILCQFQNSYLSVTEKGKSVINHNQYIFFFTKHERTLDISIFEAENEVTANPETPLPDVAMKILDQRKRANVADKDVMALSVTIDRKGYVYELLDDYDQAIMAYIGAAYYDYLFHQLDNIMEFFAAYCTIDRLMGILRSNEELQARFDDLFSEGLAIYIKFWQDSGMPAVKNDVMDFYYILAKKLELKTNSL